MSHRYPSLGTARRLWRRSRVLWSVQAAYMAEYRAEIALWALSGLLPFIMLAVWGQAEQRSGTLVAPGFGPAELARYFLCAFVVRQFTVVWVVWQFEEDSLQGRLACQLLQPLHPLWRHLAAHYAEQATRLPFVLLIASGFLLLQPSAFHWPEPQRLLLALLAVGLAFAIHFLLQSLIACLCFWSERAAALERLLYVPYLFLSGLVAPLQALPPGWQRAALATPFPYLIGFPAQLLAALPEISLQPFSLATGFGVMLLWLGSLWLLLRLLWRAGLRRYSAMGA